MAAASMARNHLADFRSRCHYVTLRSENLIELCEHLELGHRARLSRITQYFLGPSPKNL